MKGTIIERKDGRWMGVVELPKDGTGKRRRKYIYGKSYTEVEEKQIELLYDLQNSLYVKGAKTKFGVYLDEWVNNYTENKSETTAELYKMYAEKHVKPLLQGYQLDKILPVHITKFCNQKLKEGLSKNTVGKLFAFLNRAFKDAVRNRIIKYNPCDGAERPKKEKFTPEIYTEEQMIKLLTLVRGTFDEICIVLAGYVGLRRGEIFGLKWKDIDYENCTITVTDTIVRWNKYVEKGPKNESSQRKIKAPQFVIELLQEYRKNNINSIRVCEEFKPDSYSKHFKNLLIKHNLPQIRFHDLRHFNATIMLRYGVPDKVASKRLGHSQVSTTREIYQHVVADMDIEAANILEKSYRKV